MQSVMARKELRARNPETKTENHPCVQNQTQVLLTGTTSSPFFFLPIKCNALAALCLTPYFRTCPPNKTHCLSISFRMTPKCCFVLFFYLLQLSKIIKSSVVPSNTVTGHNLVNSPHIEFQFKIPIGKVGFFSNMPHFQLSI